MPELEGDGAVMTGDSAKDGEDVGDPTEDGEVIDVPADGETASLLSFRTKIKYSYKCKNRQIIQLQFK